VQAQLVVNDLKFDRQNGRVNGTVFGEFQNCARDVEASDQTDVAAAAAENHLQPSGVK